jgi:lysylphosphatidylglycerol synthetase-like protein (DUF2156 family)
MDNPSGEPGPVFKLSVVTVALAAGVGLIHFPIPVVTEQAAKAGRSRQRGDRRRAPGNVPTFGLEVHVIGRYDIVGLIAIVVAIGTVIGTLATFLNWTQFSWWFAWLILLVVLMVLFATVIAPALNAR